MPELLSLAFAFAALLISSAAFFFAARTHECDHAASLTAMNSQLRELDADLDDVFDRMKRLTSRKGMQARREEVKAGAMLAGETPEQWKARVRALRKNGQLPIEEA